MPASKLMPFFSMVEKRKLMHREIIKQFSGQGERIMQNVIPYSSLVERMGIYREPVVSYRPGLPASQAYKALWIELHEAIKSGK